jgi:hypothetical protein
MGPRVLTVSGRRRQRLAPPDAAWRLRSGGWAAQRPAREVGEGVNHRGGEARRKKNKLGGGKSPASLSAEEQWWWTPRGWPKSGEEGGGGESPASLAEKREAERGSRGAIPGARGA